jgi:Putative prokaryotic signal transducing protein
MFCPECLGEYREGFVECADCGVALVAKLPTPELEEIPDEKLVALVRTGDLNELAFAEAVLTDAEIPFVKKGESVQDLFALGRVGMGFNPITGPIVLLVSEEHAAEAAKLIKESEQAELDGLEELDEEDQYDDEEE